MGRTDGLLILSTYSNLSLLLEIDSGMLVIDGWDIERI